MADEIMVHNVEESKIQLYQHEKFGDVRIVDKEGNPWFVGTDVAKALGYERPGEAISAHCKKVNKINYGVLGLNIIPESDVYRLVLRSHLESAEAFQDWVLEDVLPNLRKNGFYGQVPTLPYHVRRYMMNKDRIPRGHFSVMNEMMSDLIAPLEQMGYILPEKLRPDISIGMGFCKLLRSKGVDTNALPTYQHVYNKGYVVEAKAYPYEFLPVFKEFMEEVWLPIKALAYFKEKDPVALEQLTKYLTTPGIRGYLEEED